MRFIGNILIVGESLRNYSGFGRRGICFIVGTILFFVGLILFIGSLNLPSLFAGQYLIFSGLMIVAGVYFGFLDNRTWQK